MSFILGGVEYDQFGNPIGKHASKQVCKHNNYIGNWATADYFCGLCEVSGGIDE